MSYRLGAKALKRLVLDKDSFAFFQAKLSLDMFKGEDLEKPLYEFIKGHYDKFQGLPAIETVAEKFPGVTELEVPEPPKVYLSQVEQRYGYDILDRSTKECRELLKADQWSNVDAAANVLRDGLSTMMKQRFRNRILDVGKEVPELLLTTYHGMLGTDLAPVKFGWPYMDDLGGAMPGDVVSFVGRPATGKTFKMLRVALFNWHEMHENVMFVSGEMGRLPLAQRVGSMYAGTNIKQLKVGGYSSETFELFVGGLEKMQAEPAKLYIVEAQLAGSVEEFFALAEILKCRVVVFDGAYLLRHPDRRLNRYDRAAENVEWIKRLCEELRKVSFASWQLNREATKKVKDQKKGGPKVGIEDIGYSDAIGQISSIVLGIMQDESIETLVKRHLDLLKGRNGEVGGFDIHWDFDKMDFRQYGVDVQDKQEEMKDELEYV